RLMEVYQRGRAEGHEQGVSLALQSILTSPHFLYRVELNQSATNAVDKTGNEVYWLSGLELASRLSYFLWSGPPDEELLRQAASGALQEPGTLLDQVQRMLRDPRAKNLVDGFAEQWLDLRRLRQHEVSATNFPDFTPAIRDAMIEETKRLFSMVLN